MFETICYLVLGASYVVACALEKEEERLRKKKEQLNELKIKIFCYAVRHGMLYNDVVKLIEDKKLTIEEIEKEEKEHEGK